MNEAECSPELTSLGSHPYQYTDNPPVHHVQPSQQHQQPMLLVQPMQQPLFRQREISYYAASGVNHLYSEPQSRDEHEWELLQKQQQQSGNRMINPYQSPSGVAATEGTRNIQYEVQLHRHSDFNSDRGRTNASSSNFVHSVTPNSSTFYDDTEDMDDFYSMNVTHRINPPRHVSATTSHLYSNNPSQQPHSLRDQLNHPATVSGPRPVYSRALSNIVMTNRERSSGSQYASIVRDFDPEPREKYYHGGKFK